jgi:hypothetical protein
MRTIVEIILAQHALGWRYGKCSPSSRMYSERIDGLTALTVNGTLRTNQIKPHPEGQRDRPDEAPATRNNIVVWWVPIPADMVWQMRGYWMPLTAVGGFFVRQEIISWPFLEADT